MSGTGLKQRQQQYMQIWPYIIYNHYSLEAMMNISRAAANINRSLALPKLCLRMKAYFHNDGDSLPRQYGFYHKPEYRKILYGKRIRPKIEGKYHDVLTLPNQDEGIIANLFTQLLNRNVPISAQNVCMLLHQFHENKIMTKQSFDKIESHAYRHKGNYKLRSTFGGLRVAILYNRTKLMNFFLEEYKAHEDQFTVIQLLELGEVVVKNRHWTQQERRHFWQSNLKIDFCDAIRVINKGSVKLMVRAAEMLNELEEFDEDIWVSLIAAMDNKKGWGRISILEKLYPISGTFESAKVLFDKYYEELANQDQILRRYNLEELRFYTPLELIKMTEDNPSDYWPKQRTIVPGGQDAEEWNAVYEEFLLSGSVKEEAEIIRDKSMSFGYAIKDRYESMQADNVDMSSLTKEEFTELFGSYDEAMKVLKDGQEVGQEAGEGEQEQIEEDEPEK